jgi:hypothetical protein
MDRRKARKARQSAVEWGRDRGLKGKANPLLFNNRAEYNSIARFLQAMAARDAAAGEPLGMAGPTGPYGQTPQVAPRQTGGRGAGALTPPARDVNMRGSAASRNYSMPQAVDVRAGTDAYGNYMPPFVRDTYRAEQAYRGPMGPVGPAQLGGEVPDYYEDGLQEIPWGVWQQERAYQNPNYRFIG